MGVMQELADRQTVAKMIKCSTFGRAVLETSVWFVSLGDAVKSTIKCGIYALFIHDR